MRTIKNKWMIAGIGAAALTAASIGGIAIATLPASATVTSTDSIINQHAVEDGTSDGETADDQASSAPDQETADDQAEPDGETADDGVGSPTP